MSFNVSALTDYTAENQFELMTATVLGAKMMSLVTVIPNIKGASKLQLFQPKEQDANRSRHGVGWNS